MRGLHNIEKHPVHKGMYIGYADGPWRIMGGRGSWHAHRRMDPPDTMVAGTLEEMSQKLARYAAAHGRLPNPGGLRGKVSKIKKTVDALARIHTLPRSNPSRKRGGWPPRAFPPSERSASELFNAQKGRADLVRMLKKMRIPFDSHATDLYFPVTPTTRKLLLRYPLFASIATTFRSATPPVGQLWYDIPFAYGSASSRGGERRANPGRRRARGEVDAIAARELYLYADSDRRFSVGSPDARPRAIRENLLRKIKAGKYNHRQAWKLWLYLVNEAAKAYNKDYGTDHGYAGFDKRTRETVAKQMSHYFMREYKLNGWR